MTARLHRGAFGVVTVALATLVGEVHPSPRAPWAPAAAALRDAVAGDPDHMPRLEAGAVHIGAAASFDGHGATFDVAGGPVTLGFDALGRGEARVALGHGEPAIDGPDVRIARGAGVTEWWSSVRRGLEHGATLDLRPAGKGRLSIDVAVSGELTPHAASAIGALLVDAAGTPRAGYAELFVADARGVALPAEVAVERGHIVLRIDDDDARYPIAIDPLVVVYDGALEAPAVPAPLASERFGTALALSGDGTRLAVAAPRLGGGSFDVGHFHVYTRLGTGWALEDTIDLPNRYEDGYSTFSLAFSGDGSRLLGGAVWYSSGSVRSYTRSGPFGPSDWAEESQLFAPGDFGHFGASVALVDGPRAFVGNPTSTTPRGATGSAFAFLRGATGWNQELTLASPDGEAGDEVGRAVSASRDGARVAVGAPGDDTSAGTDTGSVRVHLRTVAAWAEEAVLVPLGAETGDRVGAALAMSDDGLRLVVGTPMDDTAAGTDVGGARVFSRSGAVWTEEALLLPADAAANDRFGTALALSSDGSRAFVASAWDAHGGAVRAGSIRVFARTGTRWSEEAAIVAPDPVINDQLGTSLAIPRDGSRVVAGVPYDESGVLRDVGSVRTYTLSLAGVGSGCGVAAACASGFCVDGVCCSTACGGDSPTDCMGCSSAMTGGVSGICATLSLTVAPTVTCRPVAGPCDIADVCISGQATCGADALRAAGLECRGSAGICDVSEVCSGVSASCPSDRFEDVDAVCRPSTTLCDAPERCPGSGPTCPGDSAAASGTICRASIGGCDAAEVCDGASRACPGDGLEPAGDPCRPAVGACDVIEVCSGSSGSCPGDVVRPTGVVCVPADPTNPCDLDDVCSGASGVCAATHAPATTECAPSNGDVCDVADHCAGTSADCVAEFRFGVECRAAAGSCDVAELCSGASPSCPSDAFEPLGLSCRASVDPICDPEEACDGVSSACPADLSACAPRDGGPPVDAATASDAGAGVDSGLAPDAGGASAALRGCACRARRSGGARSPLAFVLALGLALALRRGRAPRRAP